jgi:hypothetical protein
LLFFNVYRIHVDMSGFGDAAFQAFSRGYTRRLPIVVLPYGAMCLLWTLALWSSPARVSRREFELSIGVKPSSVISRTI